MWWRYHSNHTWYHSNHTWWYCIVSFISLFNYDWLGSAHSSFKQNTPPPTKSPQERSVCLSVCLFICLSVRLSVVFYLIILYSSAVSIVEVEEKKDDETEHTIQQTEQSRLKACSHVIISHVTYCSYCSINS